MIYNAFQLKNGSIRYKFITLGYHKAYFVNREQNGKHMLHRGTSNQYAGVLSALLWEQTAPLLVDLFLFSNESEFLQTLVKNKRIKEARLFNFTFRYIDDVLSINNPNFSDWVSLIYPPDLEMKETTDTAASASFLAHLVLRPSLTFTKIFSSETTRPNLTNLGHNHHWGI